MGIIFSAFLSPLAVSQGMEISGRVLIYIMMATIGYGASSIPGRWISGVFKKLILGDNIPK
jgi:hypothetical protein